MERELRILLLEDCREDAELILLELKSAGLLFTAQCVSTQPEFVDALQEFKPDLVLSDYALPDFRGMEAMIVARQHSPDLPFILVTGALGEELEQLRDHASRQLLEQSRPIICGHLVQDPG